jgi:hypothetical protein
MLRAVALASRLDFTLDPPSKPPFESIAAKSLFPAAFGIFNKTCGASVRSFTINDTIRTSVCSNRCQPNFTMAPDRSCGSRSANWICTAENSNRRRKP